MYTLKTRVTTSCTDETAIQTLVSMVTMMQDCSMLWQEERPVLDAWLARYVQDRTYAFTLSDDAGSPYAVIEFS